MDEQLLSFDVDRPVAFAGQELIPDYSVWHSSVTTIVSNSDGTMPHAPKRCSRASAASVSPIGGLTQQRKAVIVKLIAVLRQIAAKDVTGHWVQLEIDFSHAR